MNLFQKWYFISLFLLAFSGVNWGYAKFHKSQKEISLQILEEDLQNEVREVAPADGSKTDDHH